MSALLLLLIAVLLMSWRNKGPIWIFSIVWIVSVSPIALGIVNYNFFPSNDVIYTLILTSYLTSFIFGVVLNKISRADQTYSPINIDEDLKGSKKFAFLAAFAGFLGSFFTVIDFFIFKEVGLDDLSALRDVVVRATSISWFAKLASVLTWGGAYCLIYLIYYRRLLTRIEILVLSLPIIGYFLVSVFSAGRQAAFQILVLILMTSFVMHQISVKRGRIIKSNAKPLLALGVLVVCYMGYVAVARNDGGISADKAEVLAELFDFHIGLWVQEAIGLLGIGFKSFVVEFIVYFSSPIALFYKFLDLNLPPPYLGLFSFPFVARQMEPLTGVSVTDAMMTLSALMSGAGVIGVGWITSIAGLILDFGYFGAFAALIVQGYLTGGAWRHAISTGKVNDVALLVLALVLIVYMPLFIGISDTNIFFLLIFLIVSRILNKKTK